MLLGSNQAELYNEIGAFCMIDIITLLVSLFELNYYEH